MLGDRLLDLDYEAPTIPACVVADAGHAVHAQVLEFGRARPEFSAVAPEPTDVLGDDDVEVTGTRCGEQCLIARTRSCAARHALVHESGNDIEVRGTRYAFAFADLI